MATADQVLVVDEEPQRVDGEVALQKGLLVDRPVDLAVTTPAALDRGVWLRPFRNLIYAMPPFICTPDEITQVTSAMVEVARLTGSRKL